jgi:hypothetical protein
MRGQRHEAVLRYFERAELVGDVVMTGVVVLDRAAGQTCGNATLWHCQSRYRYADLMPANRTYPKRSHVAGLAIGLVGERGCRTDSREASSPEE